MNHYQVCNQCVMDTSDIEISFDSTGICNHCKKYDMLRNHGYKKATSQFQSIINRIKKRGKSHPYDCIVACSGGTDSSFILHKLKDCGL